MKKAMFMVVCLALAGCDYTVPLVETPEIRIDEALVGLWARSKTDGQIENLLILPLSKRQYMVSYPAGSGEAMYAKGCLWSGADMALVQLDWFGTDEAELPDDNRTFQYVAYTVEGDQLSVRLLNSGVVKKDISSSAELAKAITANRARQRLFREAMVFAKVGD